MELDEKLRVALEREGDDFVDGLVRFLVETSIASLRTVGRFGEGVDSSIVAELKNRLTVLMSDDIYNSVLRTGADRVVVELALAQIRRWGRTTTLSERLEAGDFVVMDLTFEKDSGGDNPHSSQFKEVKLAEIHKILTNGKMRDVRVRVTFDKIDD